MAYTYKGTKITGTKTSNTSFHASGVKYAYIGQTYYNTSSSRVYRCTVEGAPKGYSYKKDKKTINVPEAKWVYDHTDITAKAGVGVVNLGAPTRNRDNRVMSVSYKTQKEMFASTRNDRATEVDYCWYVHTNYPGYAKIGGIPVAGSYSVRADSSGETKSHSLNLASFKSASGKGWNRQDFYPCTKYVLSAVSFEVYPYNHQKGVNNNAVKTATRQFTKPRKPTFGAFSINEQGKIVSTVMKTDPGKDYAERYDTEYSITAYDSRVKKNIYSRTATTSSTEFTLSYDASESQALKVGEYIKVTFKARARGYAGASDWAEKVYYYSFPNVPTIDKSKGSSGISYSGTKQTDKITVYINTKHTTEHPVTGVYLEKLQSVDARSPAEATASAEWEKTGASDNANSKALTVPVANVVPAPGKTSWVRVVSWHDLEDTWVTYGGCIRLEKLETKAPTAADDKVTIKSVTPDSDGTSVALTLAWKNDDSDGTEISWSESSDAWQSTEPPQTFNVDWKDASSQVAGWANSATVHVRGLEEGKIYHFRARRYMEGDYASFGAYCKEVICAPSSAPMAVALSGPPSINIGSGLTLSWGFESDQEQKSWRLLTDDDVPITSGTGDASVVTLSPEEVATHVVDGKIDIKVEVSTGGSFIESNVKTVIVANPPVIEIDLPDTITSQPVSFDVASDTAGVSLAVSLFAQFGTTESERGTAYQLEGDTIWTGIVTPQEWTDGTTTVELPANLDLWDTDNYTLGVVATDVTSGLNSEAVYAETKIAWAHQAPTPSPEIEIEGTVEVSEDGSITRRADIQLAAPTGAAETDVYDIYRLGLDDPELVVSGLSLTDSVVDMYAPFGGERYYRIVLRTFDGDRAWSDFAYTLDGEVLRIDSGAGYAELPYNLVIQDAYEKDFEAKAHIDGGVDGYWNSAVTRTSGLSADIPKEIDVTTMQALRTIAGYAGPCFVRTPDGDAYQANVNLSGIDSKSSVLATVSIDTHKVDLTDEFGIQRPKAEGEPDVEEE